MPTESDRERANRYAEDNIGLYQLAGRQAYLLTGVANGLYGEPGPLMMRDHSGLPAAAAEVRQIVVECLNEVQEVTDLEEQRAIYTVAMNKLFMHLELR